MDNYDCTLFTPFCDWDFPEEAVEEIGVANNYDHNNFTDFRDFVNSGEQPDERSQQSDEESDDAGICAICSLPAHGFHFRVLTCRACAAFFRRAIVSEKQYKCKSKTGNCEITIARGEQTHCRFCRLQKCRRLGMTPDNARITSTNAPRKRFIEPLPDYYPAPISTAEETSSVVYTVSNPEVDDLADKMKTGLYFAKLVAKDDNGATYDWSTGSHIIQEIFANFRPDIDYGMPITALQRLQIGRRYYQRNQRLEEVKFAHYGKMCHEWFEDIVRMGEFMCHSEEFGNLPFDEKITVYRTSWFACQQLNMIWSSLEIFGEELFTKKKMIRFTKFVVSESTTFQREFMGENDAAYFKALEEPFHSLLLTDIAKPLETLKLSETELVYALCQLIWHVENHNVSKETQKVADEFRERISHELHDYYVHIERTPNYAHRLFQIMEIVNRMSAIVRERQKVAGMARLFDVRKVEITNGDVIEDSL